MLSEHPYSMDNLREIFRVGDAGNVDADETKMWAESKYWLLIRRRLLRQLYDAELRLRNPQTNEYDTVAARCTIEIIEKLLGTPEYLSAMAMSGDSELVGDEDTQQQKDNESLLRRLLNKTGGRWKWKTT